MPRLTSLFGLQGSSPQGETPQGGAAASPTPDAGALDGFDSVIGQDPLSQLPPAVSTFSESVDGVFYFTLYLCAFFFVLICGVLAYAVVKYRRKTEDQPPASMMTHNTALEVTWTVIPLVLIMILFAWGWRGVMDMTTAPADALQYEVQGRQWAWGVKHPGDTSYVTLSKEHTADAARMYVPIDTNVRVVMHSTDVLHAFYVPAFRVKRDVLPGRNQMVWFKATRKGSYPLFCAEYCGDEHSYMMGTIEVVSKEEFASYTTPGAQAPWRTRPEDPIEWGKQLYNNNCKSCHNLTEEKLVGPGWKGLWGKEREFSDGTKAVADAAYILESIRKPNAKKVKGYENAVMNPYSEDTLDQEAVDAIIEFIKTLE